MNQAPVVAEIDVLVVCNLSRLENRMRAEGVQGFKTIHNYHCDTLCRYAFIITVQNASAVTASWTDHC